jgi:hypothetical protein
VKNGGRNCYSYDKGDAKSEAVIAENYEFLFGKPEVKGLDMKKSCDDCKYVDTPFIEEPCHDCDGLDCWEAPDHESTPEHDPVNHPSHYCQEGSMECIDEMVAVFGREAVMNFCLLNVWKYRKRAVFKNGEEDLKKSDWYMKKYIELKGDM